MPSLALEQERVAVEGDWTPRANVEPRNNTMAHEGDQSLNMEKMIPILGCVFLGTVSLMLILFLMCRYCRKKPGQRQENVGQCHAVNTLPPAYRASFCACGSAPSCHRVHSQYHVGCVRDNCEPFEGRRTMAEFQYREMGETPLSVNDIYEINAHSGTLNPVFEDDNDVSASGLEMIEDSGMEIRDLYKLTDRSVTQTIGKKLVVSVTHLVDHSGDVLYLDNMGISLKIPEGAVKRGDKQIIFLVLNWDLSDNPEMKENESLVSPVVYVGPHGLKLKKPCTLSFRHCSYNSRHIRVMRSETDLYVRKNWNVLHEQNDASSLCYMTQDECQLKTDTFSLYTCVQAPLEDRVGKKWLQLAAFACPLRKDIDHHQIRVYFLNKTPCALQWAIQNEATFGGKMICPEKVFLFDGNALDMFARTRYISGQWTLVEPGEVDKISFLKIWHGHCPHISICYRRAHDNESHSNATSVAIEMNLHLYTYQNTREDEGEKLVIQISEDSVTPKTNQESVCSRHHIGEIVIDINPERSLESDVKGQGQETITHVKGHGHQRCNEDGDGDTSKRSWEGEAETRDDTDDVTQTRPDSSLKVVVITNQGKHRDDRFETDPTLKGREMPNALRKKLKILLDAKHMFGSDWRDFAEKIGLDKCIPILKQVESPTEKLLDEAERQNIKLEALRDVFNEIDREDCALEVGKYLGTIRSTKVPVENGNSAFQCNQGNVTACETGKCLCRSDRSLEEYSFDCSNPENQLSNPSGDNDDYVAYPRNIPIENGLQQQQTTQGQTLL